MVIFKGTLCAPDFKAVVCDIPDLRSDLGKIAALYLATLWNIPTDRDLWRSAVQGTERYRYDAETNDFFNAPLELRKYIIQSWVSDESVFSVMERELLTNSHYIVAS